MGLVFVGLEAAGQFKLVLQERPSPSTTQRGVWQRGAKCPLSFTLQKATHTAKSCCHSCFPQNERWM